MAISTLPTNFMEQASQFLGALVEWERDLPAVAWDDFAAEAQRGQVVLCCVDIINGFCHEGALASPRIQGIIPAVVDAFNGAYAIGVRDFLLPQDCHPQDAVEFADFPPHCQAGSREAETVPELTSLSFANLFTVVPKNSLNAFHGTKLAAWLDAHHEISTAIVVGDCTDLCVHQMAMHLKLYANQHNLKWRVVVPENAVQTYDLPVETAKQMGVLPHQGDFLHLLSLYHMRLNGIEVVREISAPTLSR